MKYSIILSASVLLVAVSSANVKFGREDQVVEVIRTNNNNNNQQAQNQRQGNNNQRNHGKNNNDNKNKGNNGNERKKQQQEAQQQQSAANSTSIVESGANSTSIINTANSTLISNLTSNTSAITATPVTRVRNRACDQGDQALAAGMQANVVIGIAQQAAVTTLQGLAVGENQADLKTGLDRLNQFMSTANLQLQMMQGIADTASLAQPQLALLATSLADQANKIKTLTGGAGDAAILNSLATSFATSTGNSQDGASNALADCFLPLTAVSA